MKFVNTLRFSLFALTLLAQGIHAATINIAGTAQNGEEMGEFVVAGDFNCDNFDDVAASSSGQINVLYGGTGSGSRLGTPGNIQIVANWGGIVAGGMIPLAAGDFDGNGCADLAMGFPMSGVFNNSLWITHAGQVAILYGTGTGLDPNSPEMWNQNTSGVTDTAEAEDHFGQSLAAGDFNGDGYDDLAIGIIGEADDAGAVYVLHGQPIAGLTTLTTRFFTQNSSGITGSAESDDFFGFAVASGDFNNDGYDDLAIGAPFETNGTIESGVAHTLYGSSSSLSGAGSQMWQQGTSGLLDSKGDYDHFGYTLAAGDFNGDSRDDLVIGALDEGVAQGAIHAIYGTASGLSATGNQFWLGNGSFGYSLAAGDFNNNGRDDLAIGKPYDTGGSVRIFYGVASGLSTSTSPQSVSQGSSGAEGDPEVDDHFGWSVAAGDFDNNGYVDLAVGVPGEEVGSCLDCGVFQVFYNLPLAPGTVLLPVDDQMFAQ